MTRAVKTGELFATFNYDGKDSADMGIYNITSGSTYVMNIEPTFTDHKVEVPAYDGKYYYGTQITGQQFQFTCFCHDLSSTEYNRMRAWLNPRRIGKLILSDQPYKYYLVKPVSVSTLSAYPLTSIQTPDYSLMGHYAAADVIYTGNFTVTFETVGSAYGYGFSYYRDDLIYDARFLYGKDYFYNSGLLYRDMAPGLKWQIDANAKGQKIPMYNPGSAMAQPVYNIEHSGTFAEHSLLQITNYSTGASTVIDIGGITGNLHIDTKAQIITNDEDDTYYGRFSGTVMQINPYTSVIEISETWVENIENTDLREYDSFYVVDNVVQLNPKVLRVNDKMVGQYFCTNHNGGAEILDVDLEKNTLTLAGNTEDIPPATEDRPAGVAYNYIEVFNIKPDSGNQNDVCVVNDEWFIYRDGEWIPTNLFSSKDEFKNLYGDYITVYKMFGATIVELDQIMITTGTNILYKNDDGVVPGASVEAFTLTAELQPRYL